MLPRLLLVSACFLATSVYLSASLKPERVPLRESLSTMPVTLDGWSGREAPAMSDEVLALLGVDEYLNRIYVESPASVVGLYIGYYQSQREGDTIHSPMNCLPGAGWQPVGTTRVDMTIPGRGEPIHVNQVIIQKGLDRQVVYYWYQSHGRVIASEYWSKIFMVSDAVRLNRSDAALVRVISPVLTPSEAGLAAAQQRGTRFVQVMFPQLDRYLPS